MTSAIEPCRLDGLRPDNLLAFLALLGALRALEAVDATAGEGDRLFPRVSWSVDQPPVRPRLHLARALTPDEIAARIDAGIELLAADHDFDGKPDLNHLGAEARALALQAREVATATTRSRADLVSALMCDAAVKESKGSTPAGIDPTPLCLLFGQGHQHFLDRLVAVPKTAAPPKRGRGKTAVDVTAAQALAEALFAPWHYDDPTFSFRWDPLEATRYAMMAGDPTNGAYKQGTQHGANRLAAVGLACLTLVPQQRGDRVRVLCLGGANMEGKFSLAWPIFAFPMTLASLRALLAHPDLRQPGSLKHLGVDHVMVTERIPVGKFMNFTTAGVPREAVSADPEARKSGPRNG